MRGCFLLRKYLLNLKVEIRNPFSWFGLVIENICSYNVVRTNVCEIVQLQMIFMMI